MASPFGAYKNKQRDKFLRNSIMAGPIGSLKLKSSFTVLETHNLLPLRARGDPTPIAARATLATGQDFEGLNKQALSGESRFPGARRVKNLFSFSEDLSNGVWALGGGAPPSVAGDGETVTFGTGSSSVIREEIVLSNTLANDTVIVISVEMKVSSSTEIIQLHVIRNDNATLYSPELTITADWQRFSWKYNATISGNLGGGVGKAAATGEVIQIRKFQFEEVTGQANQNPSEYVSTGVATGSTEHVSNGTFDSDTTGWTAVNSSLSVVSGKLRVTSDLNQFGYVYQAFTTVVGKSYVASVEYSKETASGGIFRIATTFGGNDFLSVGGSSSKTLSGVFTATGTTTYIALWNNDNTGTDYSDFDNASVKVVEHGANIDGVQYFLTHNANTVSSGIVTEAVGSLINSSNSQYAELDGKVGSYISSPDSAAASINGDIDIRVHVAMDAWIPAVLSGLTSKWTTAGNQKSYLFSMRDSGRLSFLLSEDGSAQITANSTIAPGFSDGTAHWVRVTWSNSADLATFYTADGSIENPTESDFTQLGSTVSLVISSIFDSSAVIEVGSINVGTSNRLAGKIYRAQIYNGIDGTLAVDYSANDYDTGLTQTSSTTSEVWTYNGNASVFSPYSRWVDFPGSANDNVTSPDTPAASVTSDITLIAWVAADDWSPSTTKTIIAKYANSNHSYILDITNNPTGTLRLVLSANGTGDIIATSTSATNFVDRTGHWVRGTFNNAADTVNFYTSEDSIRTPHNQIDWLRLGDADVALSISGIYDGTADIEIGTLLVGTANLFSGKIARAVVIASTDPTVAPVVDYDPRAHVSGATFTAVTSEVWTLQGNTAIEGGRNAVAPWDVDGPYGRLPEQAGDNDLLRSENLSVAWGNSLSVDTQNTVRAPDGRLTGNTLTDDVGGGADSVNIQQNITVDSGSNTFSAYMKADQLTWARFRVIGLDTLASGYFDLVNGIIGTTSGLSGAKITPSGNGWFRCSVSFSTTTDLTGTVVINIANADEDSTVDRDGTSSIHIWGAMVNPGTFPHSYVPTTTAAKTRNKDENTYAGVGNATYPLTAALEYTPSQITQIAVLLDINNGTADERIEISVTAAGKLRVLVRAGAADVADITADDALLIGVSYSIAVVVDIDNCKLYVNGKETGTADTSMALPAAPSVISVGQDYNAANQPFGPVRIVNIFPRVMDDKAVANI